MIYNQDFNSTFNQRRQEMRKAYKKKRIALTLLHILLFILGIAASWAITVGIVWLICYCFGWTFKILIATGVWLVLILIKSLFSK